MHRTAMRVALLAAFSFLLCSAVRAQNPNNALDVTNDGAINLADEITEVTDIVLHGSHATLSSFHDVNGDGYVTPLDSLRVVNYMNTFGPTLAAPGGGGPLNITVPSHAAHISLVVADLSGSPISSVAVGQTFQLEAFAQDTRPTPHGMYAAYTDLTYSAANVSLVPGSFTLAPGVTGANTPDAGTAGILTNAGGFWSSTSTPPGGVRLPIFSVHMVAQASAIASFTSGASSSAPITDTLLFGLDVAVPNGQIDYSGASLTIVPEPPALALFGAGALAFATAARRSMRKRG
jgi:hypothetical protein